MYVSLFDRMIIVQIVIILKDPREHLPLSSQSSNFSIVISDIETSLDSHLSWGDGMKRNYIPRTSNYPWISCWYHYLFHNTLVLVLVAAVNGINMFCSLLDCFATCKYLVLIQLLHHSGFLAHSNCVFFDGPSSDIHPYYDILFQYFVLITYFKPKNTFLFQSESFTSFILSTTSNHPSIER